MVLVLVVLLLCSCLSLTGDWTAPSHLRNTDVTGREGKPQLTHPPIGEWEEVGNIRHSRVGPIRKIMKFTPEETGDTTRQVLRNSPRLQCYRRRTLGKGRGNTNQDKRTLIRQRAAVLAVDVFLICVNGILKMGL